MPDISFIICTRDRAGDIPHSLDSIAAELARFGDASIAEIVVVDNGSTDRTAEVVKGWAKTSPCRFKYVFEARPGLAIARNTGMEASSGAILAFTDDDCRLLPGYLDDLFRHYASDTEPVIRGGRVELGDPSDQPCTIKTDPNKSRLQKGVHPAGFILGCNMTMSRTVIPILGQFDERFGAGTPLKAAEETDYVLRASFAGVIAEYVPDMAVAHFHGRKTLEEIRKLNKGYLKGNGALYGKYWNRKIVAKHIYWDFKNVFREALGNFPPPKMDNGVSFYTHLDVMVWLFGGTYEYLKISLRDRFSRARGLSKPTSG